MGIFLFELKLNLYFLGCGNSFIQAANEIRPYLNSAGQTSINKLDVGIDELRNSIKSGDIDALSSNFKNIGAPGMMKLETTTTNACLKQAFSELDKIDENVATKLQNIRNPNEAARLVCDTLNSKAQILLKCLKKK